MITISKIKNVGYLLQYMDKEAKEATDEKGFWYGRGATFQKIEEKEVERDRFMKLFGADKNQPEKKSYGVDITFSAPKAWSVLFNRVDEKTREEMNGVFREALKEGARSIEENCYYRKSENGVEKYELAKSLTVGVFTHHTSRPVDGRVDCQEHGHIAIPNQCLGKDNSFYSHTLFNLIHEKTTNGEKQETLKFFDARFQSVLSDYLKEKNYELERGKGTGFEIKGIEQNVIDEFSGRTARINEVVDKMGIEHDNYAAKKTISLKTREGKIEELGMTELRKDWNKRMDEIGFTKEKIEQIKVEKQTERAKPLKELLGKDEKTISEKRLKTLALQESRYSSKSSSEILKGWKENGLQKIGGRQFLVKDESTKGLGEKRDKERLGFLRDQFEKRNDKGPKGGGGMSLSQAQGKAAQMMKASKSGGSYKASEKIASRLDELDRSYALKMLEASRADKGSGEAISKAMSEYQSQKSALVAELSQAIQQEQSRDFGR